MNQIKILLALFVTAFFVSLPQPAQASVEFTEFIQATEVSLTHDSEVFVVASKGNDRHAAFVTRRQPAGTFTPTFELHLFHRTTETWQHLSSNPFATTGFYPEMLALSDDTLAISIENKFILNPNSPSPSETSLYKLEIFNFNEATASWLLTGEVPYPTVPFGNAYINNPARPELAVGFNQIVFQHPPMYHMPIFFVIVPVLDAIPEVYEVNSLGGWSLVDTIPLFPNPGTSTFNTSSQVSFHFASPSTLMSESACPSDDYSVYCLNTFKKVGNSWNLASQEEVST